METFKVGVWEEMGGYLSIDAETREEAEKKALQIVEDVGLSFDSEQGVPVKITHRETYLV